MRTYPIDMVIESQSVRPQRTFQVATVCGARFSSRDVTGMRTELDAAEERVRSMRMAQENAEAELKRSEISLRPESDRNEVIDELAGFAERQRLTLNQIRAGRVEPGKPISVVPIIMSGTCSFADFDQTLSTLREEFPDVRIRSFSIARTLARTEQQPVFEFQLAWCIESAD